MSVNNIAIANSYMSEYNYASLIASVSHSGSLSDRDYPPDFLDQKLRKNNYLLAVFLGKMAKMFLQRSEGCEFGSHLDQTRWCNLRFG